MDEVEEAYLRALQIGPHYAATVADLGELREDFGPSRNRPIQAGGRHDPLPLRNGRYR